MFSLLLLHVQEMSFHLYVRTKRIYCWPCESRFDSLVSDRVKCVASIRCHMTVLRLNSLSGSSGNIALLSCAFQLSFIGHAVRTVHPSTEQYNATESESDERPYLWNRLALSMTKYWMLLIIVCRGVRCLGLKYVRTRL